MLEKVNRYHTLVSIVKVLAKYDEMYRDDNPRGIYSRVAKKKFNGINSDNVRKWVRDRHQYVVTKSEDGSVCIESKQSKKFTED